MKIDRKSYISLIVQLKSWRKLMHETIQWNEKKILHICIWCFHSATTYVVRVRMYAYRIHNANMFWKVCAAARRNETLIDEKLYNACVSTAQSIHPIWIYDIFFIASVPYVVERLKLSPFSVFRRSLCSLSGYKFFFTFHRTTCTMNGKKKVMAKKSQSDV